MAKTTTIQYKITKILAHLFSWLPLAWLFYAASTAQLGGDPQEEVLHELGIWGLIFLLLSLSITPLKKLFSSLPWIKFRRMLGLYGAFYIFLHLLMFVAFYLQFSLQALWSEIIERPYITVGMIAVVGLIPLVFTSTKASQRRLGKKWKKLHQLVYPIIVLALVHYIWQTKSDLNEPFLYVFWGIVIFGFRLYQSHRVKVNKLKQAS